MEQFMIILAGAVIVEALVQCLKATPITFYNASWWEVISSIVGIGIAIIMHINLIDVVTPTTGAAWYGGMIATGIIIGRGASFVHDLMNKLKV